MPIEIREMFIKAIIGAVTPNEESEEERETEDEPEDAGREDRIVAACVAQVLEILKEREEP